ncbi:glycosyl hydrolase catalytic core-domain-containing protein [Mycena rosella]|uniref:Glycosyl hydrolase catalytic core-domain-containing protein n=1 Tax=Mycena rosella TaxID=1033263 RepID=A0AAD7D4X6_MYCRO|nr:glycosyl hydrolase catalytic core-domain-containing protein [Mycena rosella]
MRAGTFCFLAAVGVVTANVVSHQERAATKTLPAGWFYVGCKVDVGNRILVAANQVSTTNTPQTCIAFCSGNGYTMAGVEFGQECWCGSSYNPVAGTVQSAADADCSSPCTGDSTQTCGGSSRIQVYQSSAGTTTTATATPTSTGSRGLAWPADNNFDLAIFKSSKVGFLYNWGHNNTPKNTVFPFYAMQWNTAGITTLEADARTAGATTILAFNEPDILSEANMTPESAASYSQQYIHPLSAKGFKLATPAVTNGVAPTGLAWLDSFLTACPGCAYDYIALHWYGGWIDDFTTFIDSAKKYGKPIYLTEFGLSWDADAQASNYEEFLPLALTSQQSPSTPSLGRSTVSGTGKNMIAADGTLTDLGKMYIA